MDRPSAHTEGLKLLARRELSVEGVRARLEDRGYSPDDIAEALARLLESGALDDRRVARAYARTAVTVKGRGRLRITQELLHMGIHKEIAAEALGEVFGELDERALIDTSIRKKLRGRPVPRISASRSGSINFSCGRASRPPAFPRRCGDSAPGGATIRTEHHHAFQGHPPQFPRILPEERPHHRAELVAGPRKRPDAALHERRHEPVQGPVPWTREALLHPRHHLAEVHARQRQTQRPRQRRPVAPPPHVLRDARQLLVRRLLQARGHPVRVGVVDERVEPAGGPPLSDDLQR